MMQRMNVRPMWNRSNVSRQEQQPQHVTAPVGTVPHPAAPISVRQANPIVGNLTNAVGSNGIPTFQGGPTPSLSAPAPMPGTLPVAKESPNPVTTSVPLAPITTGSSINNSPGESITPGTLTTNSMGTLHSIPPHNTGISPNSRVTS
ncbi:unnamed protein product [Sphagnum tenellum]